MSKLDITYVVEGTIVCDLWILTQITPAFIAIACPSKRHIIGCDTISLKKWCVWKDSNLHCIASKAIVSCLLDYKRIYFNNLFQLLRLVHGRVASFVFEGRASIHGLALHCFYHILNHNHHLVFYENS